jgi:hypothetical protein
MLVEVARVIRVGPAPYGAHWTFDSYALSAGTARSVVAEGGKSWFFITAGYTFGANLEAFAPLAQSTCPLARAGV